MQAGLHLLKTETEFCKIIDKFNENMSTKNLKIKSVPLYRRVTEVFRIVIQVSSRGELVAQASWSPSSEKFVGRSVGW